MAGGARDLCYRGHLLPYGLAIFLSAFLLFQIQPAIGKAILPWFGGSAGVWTTCLLFFQAVLLLGYIYSHLLTTRLGPRLQAAVHAALLGASLLLLPVAPDPRWRTLPDQPVLQILGLLVVSVGLPCFLLSSTSPLLQAWHACRFHSPVTYRLFSISNLASLAGLLAYPLLIEPALATHTQLHAWSLSYAAFVAACGATALLTARIPGGVKPPLPDAAPERVGVSRWMLWLALPACASALLLAVTAHLTREVAPVPLLWILPLAVYLLSFVLCFGSEDWYRPKEFRWFTLLALGVMVLLLAPQLATAPWRLAAAAMIGGLFVACVFCHGELVRLKPDPRRLTWFYLAVALGGVLGGAFVGLAAPLLYRDDAELPVAVGWCAMLVIAAAREPAPRRTFVAVAGMLALALLFAPVSALNQPEVLRFRNFYGAFRIKEVDSGGERLRLLYSGNTLHGSQFLAPALHPVATTYYSERSGAGRLLGAAGPPRRAGIVGLGAGTLAAYARPGDQYTFYEVNPLVLIAAETSFTYMGDCRGRCDVVLGDARLSLEREKPQRFDVLILDAFSGDAIPVHLLTREAFQLYFRHLKPDGVLAFHITNRYLDLAPVVEAGCEPLGKTVEIVRSFPDARGAEEAVWAIVTGGPAGARPRFRPWTDDYSNLLSILRR